MELFKDERYETRGLAAEALGRIGPEAKAAVPGLMGLLKDEDKEVRSKAAMALCGIHAPEAKEALRVLIELLRDEDWAFRLTTAQALGRIGSEAKACRPGPHRITQGQRRARSRGGSRSVGKNQQEALRRFAVLPRGLCGA